jgi:hypothetical protein
MNLNSFTHVCSFVGNGKSNIIGRSTPQTTGLGPVVFFMPKKFKVSFQNTCQGRTPRQKLSSLQHCLKKVEALVTAPTSDLKEAGSILGNAFGRQDKGSGLSGNC